MQFGNAHASRYSSSVSGCLFHATVNNSVLPTRHLCLEPHPSGNTVALTVARMADGNIRRSISSFPGPMLIQK